MKSSNSLYAAIDLGSVSFHLVIMTKRENRLVWTDCKKEIVRLAAGFDTRSKSLRPDVKKRALKCLENFHRAIRNIPQHNIRAVGTSTFRRLRHDTQFLQQAQSALGIPIEVLSGDQEAEYIYRGVSYPLPDDSRFVIDIGGGSTELIVGNGHRPLHTVSIELGCISLTQKFFLSGTINREQFALAESYASKRLQQSIEPLTKFQWNSEFGTSGSVKAISWAMQHRDLSDGEITHEALDEMREGILRCNNTQQLASYLGLNQRRTAVFCAGFILMQQAFKHAHLSYLKISQGAIREGLIQAMIEDNTMTPTLSEH
ncbi:hypothetical protein [Gynuella sunshinyii]|uniref:Exopolyphosphatase n=1 Tax=Gynuella sunshinyii YC6258 TaxID=1445510 RepID=A0A0C5V4I7_9GAMM|nr:hypothetical protein [Gynuella sunshinyii]AJQ94395.1 exopolyphosphatase [Gynuella sunshinyii YC6258]